MQVVLNVFFDLREFDLDGLGIAFAAKDDELVEDLDYAREFARLELEGFVLEFRLAAVFLDRRDLAAERLAARLD